MPTSRRKPGAGRPECWVSRYNRMERWIDGLNGKSMLVPVNICALFGAHRPGNYVLKSGARFERASKRGQL